MSDATLYSEEMYVLLVPGEAEVFLTPPELEARLVEMLDQWPGTLPSDLAALSRDEQAVSLRETACEWPVTPGVNWQWYAVRLEK